jgi:hypothetical protein
MYTKPCERADRGCVELASAQSPRLLGKMRFCSLRCSYIARVEAGTQPRWNLTAQQRHDAGRTGALVGHARRRKAAVLKAAQHVNGLMPIALRLRLTEREQALITAMLVRAWEMGHKRGMQRERKRKDSLGPRAFLEQARKRDHAA